MTITLTDTVDPAGILEPVTLPLSPGAHGLVGPNAAGKTTLLGLIHTAARTAGESAYARASADALFAGSTVADHLAVARLPRPNFDRDLADRVLEPAGLSGATGIRRLSVGQRRLLTLAGTLASGAPVLLLDEPFDGLDVSTRKYLRGVLIELLTDESLTLVISSHRSEDLVGLVDRVITVHSRTVYGPVDLDTARNAFPTLTGPAGVVGELADGKPVVAESALGPVRRVTLSAPLTPAEIDRARTEGVERDTADDATLIDLLATTERN